MIKCNLEDQPVASNEKERRPEVGVRRTRLMGPLRRDGFLLNAEPLVHVRSFHTIPGRPFFFLSVFLSSLLTLSRINPPIIISIRVTSG